MAELINYLAFSRVCGASSPSWRCNMVKLSMTRFRQVKFRMGQVHLKKGGLSRKPATKAADPWQPDICCGLAPDMCCTICCRDQSSQDNYRKWVELRAKSSGTRDIEYRVPARYGTCCEAGYTKADFHCVAKCEDCSIPICEDCADESIHRLNDFIICQICRTRRNAINWQQLEAG